MPPAMHPAAIGVHGFFFFGGAEAVAMVKEAGGGRGVRNILGKKFKRYYRINHALHSEFLSSTF
jgi:hypothetical protein